MKIYGNNVSFNSNKVRFAANAMNITHEFHSVDLMAGEQRTPDFLKINPVGRIPALADGDFMIFESVAIMRYLAEKTESALYPKDLRAHSAVNQWLDFGSIHVGGSMSKLFYNTIIYKVVGGTIDERSLSEGRQFMANYLKIVEEQLSRTVYLTGNAMTLADINILAILDPSEAVGLDLSVYPKLAAWRKSLQAKDFYQKVYPSFTEFLNSMMQPK